MGVRLPSGCMGPDYRICLVPITPSLILRLHNIVLLGTLPGITTSNGKIVGRSMGNQANIGAPAPSFRSMRRRNFPPSLSSFYYNTMHVVSLPSARFYHRYKSRFFVSLRQVNKELLQDRGGCFASVLYLITSCPPSGSVVTPLSKMLGCANLIKVNKIVVTLGTGRAP
uniref:Uncharacterized protein n=1 Tax=Amorphochlora amoebiformis TaxID=1561963 RepID=A0A0H5BKM6_9EUKA|nr:hypothetical protein [Amorphochlora amoebiformis]